MISGKTNDMIDAVLEMVLKTAPHRTIFSPKERITTLRNDISDSTYKKYLLQIEFDIEEDYHWILSELINGDFISPVNAEEDEWTLTDNGRLFKECGGTIIAYEKYIQDEIAYKKAIRDLSVDVPKNQLTTNKLIIAFIVLNFLIAMISLVLNYLQYEEIKSDKVTKVKLTNQKSFSLPDTMKILQISQPKHPKH